MPVDHQRTIKSLSQVLERQPGFQQKPVFKGKKRASLSAVFAPAEGLHEWQDAADDEAARLLPAQDARRVTGSSIRGRRRDAESTGLRSSISNDQLDKILFQAGTTRLVHNGSAEPSDVPLLCFCPSYIPSTAKTDAAQTLARISQRFDLLVQQDYAAVLFASPSSNAFSTAALVKAYFGLSRNAKKNVKRLYIVHPSFWSKMIIKVFSSIVSGKVGKRGKIQTVSSLSELATLLDIRQIEIPPVVYELNYRIEKSIALPAEYQKFPVFGAPLDLVMGIHGERGIPKVIKDCAEHIRAHGLEREGIFRIPPSGSSLNILQEAYDRGQAITLADYDSSVHLAASLIGRFLRAMPTAMVGSKEYTLIEKCPDLISTQGFDAIAYVRDQLLPELVAVSEAKVILLSYVIELLHVVSTRSSANKMDAHNLAICLAPILARSNDVSRDVRHCQVPGGPILGAKADTKPYGVSHKTTFGAVLKLMIARCYELFPDPSGSEVNGLSGQPLSTPELSNGSYSIPSSPENLPSLDSNVPNVPPLSPQANGKIGRSRTRTSSSVNTLRTSASTSGEGSPVRLIGNGRQSIRLLRHQTKGSISLRMAPAEPSAVSALGDLNA